MNENGFRYSDLPCMSSLVIAEQVGQCHREICHCWPEETVYTGFLKLNLTFTIKVSFQRPFGLLYRRDRRAEGSTFEEVHRRGLIRLASMIPCSMS